MIVFRGRRREEDSDDAYAHDFPITSPVAVAAQVAGYDPDHVKRQRLSRRFEVLKLSSADR